MRTLERLLLRRMHGIPDARTDYTVTPVRVPMRDGVELGADLYQPVQPIGTLLVRGPYGRGLIFSFLMARVWAACGYRVLFVSSRGTFDSAGDFDPMRDEAADGQDVVAWMREQPWFTGEFATIGGSYLGHTQWALLADPPPELTAAVIIVGPHDFSLHAWGTGAFNLDFLTWSDLIVKARPDARKRRFGRKRALERAINGLPLADAADAYFDGQAPWYRYRVTHPDLTDPYWTPMRHTAAVDQASVPILLLTGWQDIFLGQTMFQYERLRARGADVELTVGPWTHTEAVARQGRTTTPLILDWLRGRRRGANPVRVFVTGADVWRDLPEWPPPTTDHVLHLGEGGTLDPAETGSHGESGFTFDPAAPTPTVGGPLIDGGGVLDDSALAARPDVLAFTSAPLEHDLDMLGAPTVQLAHSTDNPHADLFLRISDVDPSGRSHNVTEIYRRLDPARGPEPIRLTLLPAAHRFRAGHRVRLLIAGGSHPQFARNLGTGENPGTGSTVKPARHTIDHGAVHLPGV